VRARSAASVILAAGILMGTSACGFYSPQATTIHYDASDGVSGNVGDVAIRNALLLSEDGETANLLATVINQGDTTHSLEVQYEAKGEKVTQNVTIAAHETVTLGTPGSPAVTVENMDSAPGKLFPVFFQYGDETGAELLLPILDGTQGEYSTLLPTETPAPSEAPSEAPAPTETPAPTPTHVE